MSHDLAAAAKVQQSLLPVSKPNTTRASFAWEYIPCDELAGDFLNCFALDERHVAAFVVDVSGHGVASSLLAVTIGRLLTAQVSSSSLLVRRDPNTGEPSLTPPSEVANELNQRFPMDGQNGLYFTMVYGILDLETLQFTYVSAGHPPLALVPYEGRPRLLTEGGGMGIGWVDGIEYEQQCVQLKPGDRVYLYSDGVPEAMDAELNQFGDQRMTEIMELGKARPLGESVSLLLASVKRWCARNGPKDDISILALEVKTGASA